MKNRNTKHMGKKLMTTGLFALLICAFCSITAFAVTDEAAAAAVGEAAALAADAGAGSKAIAAAICVGVAAAAGALGMGFAIAKSSEGISRQPEAAGSIRTGLMLGLVFIETAIIYALIIAILIIFVL